MKDFFERMIELISKDKELHDAIVRSTIHSYFRLVNASAEEKEIRNQERKDKKKVI